MVHLPFFLQNSGLRKLKTAQKSSQSHRKSVAQYEQSEPNIVTSVILHKIDTWKLFYLNKYKDD